MAHEHTKAYSSACVRGRVGLFWRMLDDPRRRRLIDGKTLLAFSPSREIAASAGKLSENRREIAGSRCNAPGCAGMRSPGERRVRGGDRRQEERGVGIRGGARLHFLLFFFLF